MTGTSKQSGVRAVVLSGRRQGHRYLFTIRHVRGDAEEVEALGYDQALRMATRPCERHAPPADEAPREPEP
jgi:hypothetical protein